MAMQLDEKPALVGPPAAAPEGPVRWWHRFADIYETESGPSRIVPMEGVRGWAVLLVFFVHFHGAFSKYLSSSSPLFTSPNSWERWEPRVWICFSSSAAT